MVAKFQGDKSASRNLPWNFFTHGFLDRSAFSDVYVPRKRGFTKWMGFRPVPVLFCPKGKTTVSYQLGAFEMTTQFLTIKFAKLSQNLLALNFQKEQRIWTIFPSSLQSRTPLPKLNFIFILIWRLWSIFWEWVDVGVRILVVTLKSDTEKVFLARLQQLVSENFLFFFVGKHRCCFPHLLVVNKLLRFWPSQTESNW